MSAAEPTLELRTLPERHPEAGTALLHVFGPATIYRLRGDPDPVEPGTTTRGVTVDRLSPRTGPTPTTEDYRIGWADLLEELEAVLVQLRRTLPDDQITEQAAIGVMCLLMHELEGCSLRRSLPIGSGGDYLFDRDDGTEFSVEVSGITEADYPSRSSDRLREKCKQVLSKGCPSGFASVTTFRYPNTTNAHSYLHYVREQPKPPKGSSSRKRK